MQYLRFCNEDMFPCFEVSDDEGKTWEFCWKELMDVWENKEFQRLVKQMSDIKREKAKCKNYDDYVAISEDVQVRLVPIYEQIDALLTKLGENRYKYCGRTRKSEIMIRI